MKKVLIFVVLAVIAMQLIPVDFTNPGIEKGKDFFTINKATPEVETLIKSACYDCHSYETVYPEYSKIAPVNFWMKQHIDEGREHLNFSEWGNYSLKKREHKLEESNEEIAKGAMPLKSYTWTHGDAKLNEKQVQLLVDFFKQAK